MEPNFKKFTDAIINLALSGDLEIDTHEVQELAEENGILKAVTMNEPCDPVCNCMEYGYVNFPTECLRKNYKLNVQGDENARK